MASPPHGDHDDFLQRTQQRAGLTDPFLAERAILSVLSVISEELPHADRAWFAHALPVRLSAPITGTLAPLEDDLPRFYERVAAREGVALGFAVEHARSVCSTLAESLNESSLQHLSSRLPDALQPLLERPEALSTPAAPLHEAPDAPRNLSRGRPFSRHPLSESHAPDAQQESVARSDNPHADEKLSSTRGTTQERESETLSRGHH